MNKEEKSSDKCPICKRPTHKESIYCIFHASAEEKTEEKFKQALKEYVNKIKEENKNYNFDRFVFIGKINFKEDLNIAIFKNANFRKATFKEFASFWRVTFEGDAFFWGVTFEGDAVFEGATFEGDAYFWETTFGEDVDFWGATFEKDANFAKATFGVHTDFGRVIFKGNTNFRKATFEGNTYFAKATFEKDTNFRKATFEVDVNFEKVTFEGDIDFEKVTFEGDVGFRIKYCVKIVNFSGIKVFSGKKLFIKLNNKGGKISFERAYLENTYLDLELVESILIDFAGVSFKNSKIKKGQIENHILQEKEKKYFEAQEIYLLLKNNFHSIGKYEDESWAFKKEKDMERLSYSFNSFIKNMKNKEKKSNRKVPKGKRPKFISFFNWLKTKNFRKWLSSCFLNIIYGYGERPRNVILSAVFIIILFSIFFSFLGINSPEIIKMKSPTVQEIFNSNSEIISKGNIINKTSNYFIDCVYFSTITFTTLGYGDFRPLEGWGRILAGSEAFIGAFMMALFVYTFARRTGGR